MTSVDPARGTLRVATVDGRPQPMYVKGSALRQALEALSPGDAVTVTYTEPMPGGLRRADERSAKRCAALIGCRRAI